MITRLTICELPDVGSGFESAWTELASHVKKAKSDIVLLPEMPFYTWLARHEHMNETEWDRAVNRHETWLKRLPELGDVTVLGSRPISSDGGRWNEAFVWSERTGYHGVHRKYYLPDEELFWEARWYQRGPLHFEAAAAGTTMVGFLICSEIWFSEHARSYGRQGIHILVCPRATEAFSVDKWLVGGQAAAVVSGAYCVSSNRGGDDGQGICWGGSGWIVDPDGRVIGCTSTQTPFITVSLDLTLAEAAKSTYPRYISE